MIILIRGNSLGVVLGGYAEMYERLTKITPMWYSNAPDVYHYVHKKFAMHLLNMSTLYYDLRMELHRTTYKWLHLALTPKHSLVLRVNRHTYYNRQNKVGLMNQLLKSILFTFIVNH